MATRLKLIEAHLNSRKQRRAPDGHWAKERKGKGHERLPVPVWRNGNSLVYHLGVPQLCMSFDLFFSILCLHYLTPLDVFPAWTGTYFLLCCGGFGLFFLCFLTFVLCVTFYAISCSLLNLCGLWAGFSKVIILCQR
jgi:hypothetical protein